MVVKFDFAVPDVSKSFQAISSNREYVSKFRLIKLCIFFYLVIIETISNVIINPRQ